MLKILIVSCLFLININSIADAEKLYYEDKNLQAYIDKMKSLSMPINSHVEKIIILQTSLIIDTYPNSYEEILAIINTIPENLKSLMVQGIVNVKGQDVAINKNYKFQPQELIAEINNFKYILPSNNEKDHITNTSYTDYLWAAFDITGNKKYLQQIITFLSQIPLKSRIIGAELMNRMMIDATLERSGVQGTEVKDLVSQITKEELYEAQTYQIVSWSLQSMRKRCPKIDDMVKLIFEENPDLNFELALKRAYQ